MIVLAAQEKCIAMQTCIPRLIVQIQAKQILAPTEKKEPTTEKKSNI